MDNNKDKAVALRYDPLTNQSPYVIAKGEKWLADKIVEIGSKHGIPLYKDARLVNRLLTVDVTSEIPPELYEAVASVLVFIYRLDQSG